MKSVLYHGAAYSGRATSLIQLFPPVATDGDALSEQYWNRLAAGVPFRGSEVPETLRVAVLRVGNVIIADAVALLSSDYPPAVRVRNILADLSAVVFVASSAPERQEANARELDLLRNMLEYGGRSIDDTPVVFQLNHRDLSEAVPVAEMMAKLKSGRCAYHESIATQGVGVRETFMLAVTMAANMNL